MHDVFISYVREDRVRVARLAEGLVGARGWSVWWDSKLRAGEPFARRIQEALAQSRCVVVVWSAHAVDSDWVAAEATEGWSRGILVPVRVDDCEPPLPFRQAQTVDLTQWTGSRKDGAFLALLEGVQRVLAHGEAVDRAELEIRERRRQAYRRRQLARRLAAPAGLLVGMLIAVLVGRTYLGKVDDRNRAEALARQANDVRQQATTMTPEEQRRFWWANLDEKRLRSLEISVLLATEGVQRARTEVTEQALRASLALLPWSDWSLEIDYENTPCVLDFSHDGQLVAAGGSLPGTLVVRRATQEITARIAHGGTGGRDSWPDKRGNFAGIRGSCDVIDFSPSADIVATAGPDETAALWDAATGRELHRLPHDAVVTSVAFDSTGRLLATATEGGAVALWDSESGRLLHRMRHDDAAYWVGFSPSSRHLASASLDRSVRVWDPGTGEERLRLEHEDAVDKAHFTPDESAIATFGDRVPVHVWDAVTGEERWRLPDESAGAADVVFGAQGRIMIAGGGVDGEITWWDLPQRTPLFSVSHDVPYVRRMSRTPDGRFVVTIGGDDEARVWDFATGRLLKRLPYGGTGMGGGLFGLAISPDGRWLATAGLDPFGGERLIDITEIWPQDPVAAACSEVSSNLTHDEWHRYVGAESYHPTCPGLEEER